jgi:hypothetical protein
MELKRLDEITNMDETEPPDPRMPQMRRTL